MKDSIKEQRHKEIHGFILKCLELRPLSLSQIWGKLQQKSEEFYKRSIQERENSKKQELRTKKEKFNISQVCLKKDHLNYLEKKKLVLKVDRKIPLQHEKWKLKIDAETFLKGITNGKFVWEKGGQRNYLHAYYFATPRTYFVKEEIFDKIIREKFLKGEFKEYISNKDEIEELLEESEKIMSWIEMFPNTKEGYPSRNKSDNFTQNIIDFVCEGKDTKGTLFAITDLGLAPILMKIERLFLFENTDHSYINVYRILRKELYEREIFRLPEEYKGTKGKKKEEFYKKEYDEKIEGEIFAKILEEQLKKDETIFS